MNEFVLIIMCRISVDIMMTEICAARSLELSAVDLITVIFTDINFIEKQMIIFTTHIKSNHKSANKIATACALS